MRTTLTLDDDVAIQLKRLCAERDERFKTVVNRALRAGLARLTAGPEASGGTYCTEPVSLGTPQLPSLDDIAEVLAVVEGEERR